jgi:hypothetical protein
MNMHMYTTPIHIRDVTILESDSMFGIGKTSAHNDRIFIYKKNLINVCEM